MSKYLYVTAFHKTIYDLIALKLPLTELLCQSGQLKYKVVCVTI